MKRDSHSSDGEDSGSDGSSKTSELSPNTPSPRQSPDAKHFAADMGGDQPQYKPATVEGLENLPPNFMSVRLSNINPRIPDDDVRDSVTRAFRIYGPMNVKFAHTVDRRLVYVNFQTHESALEAYTQSLNKLELFERIVMIEAVPLKIWNRPGFHFMNQVPIVPTANRPDSPSHGEGWEPLQQYPAEVPFFMPQQRFLPEKQFNEIRHLEPEMDRRSTRTLFVANIDDKMDPKILRRYFDPYGFVQEIDIKIPQRGSPYAFVRFHNLDMAHKAKVALSGKMLGKNQCKIGYARPVPTPVVWIGNLGSWANKEDLTIQFERFGRIIKFARRKGSKYAFILYDNVESAKVAINEMKGFMMPGATKGLRTDFAEQNQMDGRIPKRHKKSKKSRKHKRSSHSSSRSGSEHSSRSNSRSSATSASSDASSYRKKSSRSGSSSSGSDSSTQRRKSAFQIGNVEASETITDLARCLPLVWSGPLELKNSSYPTHMHMVSSAGGVAFVNSHLAGLITPSMPCLKITQRLRLEKAKIKEVERRIKRSGSNWCVLLAVPDSDPARDAPGPKRRPLSNLVSYLKEKNAAGVFSLPPNTPRGQETGLMHVFPPSEYARKHLRKCAPRLNSEEFEMNGFVLVIIVQI